MKPVFIIEHLEPKLWSWCLIEYKHISRIVGKNNVWFTNIKKNDVRKLQKYGKVFTESVKSMVLENTCVLDPEAKNTLEPKDSKQFKYFIFGGILGDNPPRKRTTPELTQFIKKAQVRNIGKEQLSTDNAVFVVHQIAKGKPLEKIKFIDSPEIIINKIESTILPFRYPLVKGKPNIPKDLINYLKKDVKM